MKSLLRCAYGVLLVLCGAFRLTPAKETSAAYTSNIPLPTAARREDGMVNLRYR